MFDKLTQYLNKHKLLNVFLEFSFAILALVLLMIAFVTLMSYHFPGYFGFPFNALVALSEQEPFFLLIAEYPILANSFYIASILATPLVGFTIIVQVYDIFSEIIPKFRGLLGISSQSARLPELAAQSPGEIKYSERKIQLKKTTSFEQSSDHMISQIGLLKNSFFLSNQTIIHLLKHLFLISSDTPSLGTPEKNTKFIRELMIFSKKQAHQLIEDKNNRFPELKEKNFDKKQRASLEAALVKLQMLVFECFEENAFQLTYGDRNSAKERNTKSAFYINALQYLAVEENQVAQPTLGHLNSQHGALLTRIKTLNETYQSANMEIIQINQRIASEKQANIALVRNLNKVSESILKYKLNFDAVLDSKNVTTPPNQKSVSGSITHASYSNLPGIVDARDALSLQALVTPIVDELKDTCKLSNHAILYLFQRALSTGYGRSGMVFDGTPTTIYPSREACERGEEDFEKSKIGHWLEDAVKRLPELKENIETVHSELLDFKTLLLSLSKSRFLRPETQNNLQSLIYATALNHLCAEYLKETPLPSKKIQIQALKNKILEDEQAMLSHKTKTILDKKDCAANFLEEFQKENNTLEHLIKHITSLKDCVTEIDVEGLKKELEIVQRIQLITRFISGSILNDVRTGQLPHYIPTPADAYASLSPNKETAHQSNTHRHRQDIAPGEEPPIR